MLQSPSLAGRTGIKGSMPSTGHSIRRSNPALRAWPPCEDDRNGFPEGGAVLYKRRTFCIMSQISSTVLPGESKTVSHQGAVPWHQYGCLGDWGGGSANPCDEGIRSGVVRLATSTAIPGTASGNTMRAVQPQVRLRSSLSHQLLLQLSDMKGGVANSKHDDPLYTKQERL
jgi:hypothetical protein